MTEPLPENLIHLRCPRLTSDLLAKLGFDHRKGGLDVAPLMVMAHELLLLAGIQMKHAPPCCQALVVRFRVGLESDVRHRSFGENKLRVLVRALTRLLRSNLFRLNDRSDSGWPQSETERRGKPRRFLSVGKIKVLRVSQDLLDVYSKMVNNGALVLSPAIRTLTLFRESIKYPATAEPTTERINAE